MPLSPETPRSTPRFRLSGALLPYLLLADVGCNEVVPPGTDAEEVKLWQVNTARGAATLPYREIGGWAISDDILLGRADAVRPRDFHIGNASWPNGIITYVWDVSSAPIAECSVDEQRFCYGEWEYLTQGVGPNGIPIWEEFKQHVVSETSLSLVDATECYYDPSCNEYLEPGTFVFVRRPVPISTNDYDTECAAVNNTKIQLTTFTLMDVVGETWDLDIDGKLWSVPGTGIAADDAQAIVDALTTDPDYNDLPVTAARNGATVELQAKQPVAVTISLTGTVSNTGKYEKGGNGSCVGARSCANSDCDAGLTCVAVWPYGPEFSISDTGYCQQGGGIATLGPGLKNGDTPPSIGLPTGWFLAGHFTGMAHELMHVAGFIHEHQRPDNYDAVFSIADPDCALYPDSTDLDKNKDYDLYGWASPLDWASAMMYGSNSLCIATPECKNMCLNAVDGACPDNICAPNTAYNADKPDPNLPDLDIVRGAGWFEGLDRLGNRIDVGKLGLSYKDQDALRMYAGNAFAQAFVEGQCPWFPDDGDMLPEQAYSGPELRDNFASALAIGRFGDEDNGVLVGIPGEEEDYLDIKSGAATVWEGNRYVLELANDAPMWETANRHLPAIPIISADQFLVPQEFAVDFPPVEAGDGFGSAVAAVDFNGDGIDEIAIGAPRAGFNSSGLVYLYQVSNAKQKHRPWRVLKPDTDLDTWEFGYALAAGNFAGKDNNDSCVSRHRQELAVGSPRMVDSTGVRSGAAYVYRWDSVAQDFVRRDLAATTSDNNQRFGHALAAADLDGDHRDGLVVGAPMYGATDAGRVYFYESDTPVDVCHMQLQQKGSRTGSLSQGHLGSAIAAGDFLRGTGEFASPDDVAVGAPRPGSAGYVELFKGTGTPLAVPTVFSPHTTLKQVANGLDTDEIGDEFGFALAVTEYSQVFNTGDEPRPAYLYIGAPAEKDGGGEQTGAVYQVRFSYDLMDAHEALRGDVRVTAACPAGSDFGCGLQVNEPELAERFGAAIAANRRILVIGDPSFDLPDSGTSAISDVGAARVYVRERDPAETDGWYLMRWFTEQNDWPSSGSDYLP